MGSLSKRQKLSNPDRISDLHDSLLLHILSFLHVKVAASTSSLSKRWQHLCKSLPNLDFDDDDFCQKPSDFIKCVDYFLMAMRYNVSLESFSLSCGAAIDAGRVDSWLWRAVRLFSVKVIKLSLDLSISYKLRAEVYTCMTLEVLILNWNILIDVPEFISLPRLKVLQLCGIAFLSSDAVQKLLINSPVLEELAIQDCSCLSGNHINIFGSALKTLRLQYSANFKEGDELEFSIDAPAVLDLYIDISEVVKIKTQMLLLETATIDGYLNGQQPELSNVHTHGVFGILENISHVRRLTLTSDIIVVLSGVAKYTLPKFHNLTDLELLFDGGAGPAGWSLLPKILASSPRLVNLVFPRGLARGFYAEPKPSRLSFIKQDIVPECLSFRLKNIQIGHFRGIAEEFIIIEYLLKYGRVLNMMLIDCSRLWMKEMTVGTKRKPHRPLIFSEIKKKLFEFHRCSTSCKLDLSHRCLKM